MARRSSAQAKLRSRPTATASAPPALLTLPGEIRNQIYHHVLSTLATPTVPFLSQPPLYRTSRLLRHELLSLTYGTTTVIIPRDLGAQVATWSTALRPSLFYLRSIRFELFTEFTAAAPELEGPLCGTVAVHAWLVGTGDSSTTIVLRVEGGETCMCKFARCARDVERGVLGDARDAPLIRFLTAWDLPAPPVRGDRFLVCEGCGGGNVQVSLRDIRRKASLGAVA